MKNILVKATSALLIAGTVVGFAAGGITAMFRAETEGSHTVKPGALYAGDVDSGTPVIEELPVDENDMLGSVDLVDGDVILPSEGPIKHQLFGAGLPSQPIDSDQVPTDPKPPVSGGTTTTPPVSGGTQTTPPSNEDTKPTTPAKPSIDGSGLISGILSKNYGSGIQVFQSARNDIPTDTSALNSVINKGSNSCSFIAVRLSDGATISYNVNKLYRCASSYKALTALYTFKQAAAGAYNLNTGLTYTTADYYSGSGIIKSSAFGTVYTLRQVADYSIRYSDNAAFIMLQRYINRSDLVKFAADLGCPNAAGFEYTWPNVSALDAAVWWAEIYNFANSSSYGRELYNVYLNATNPIIKKALGGEHAVAHKSGSMSYYFHDAGIVESEDPYLLVVYTHNPYNGSSNNQSYVTPIVQEIDKLINP